MEPFEIVHSVLEKHRIAEKLAGITGKSAEFFRSHGREPRSSNPLQSGNVSPVTHFMRYVRQFAACDPEAGRLLLELVASTLSAEMGPQPSVTQRDSHAALIREFADVSGQLAVAELDDLSTVDLKKFEVDVAEVRDALEQVAGHVRAVRLARGGKR